MKKLITLLSLGLMLGLNAEEPTAQVPATTQEKTKMEEYEELYKWEQEPFLKELEARRDVLEKVLPKFKAECEKDPFSSWSPTANCSMCLKYCKLSREYLDTLNKIEEVKYLFSFDERKAALKKLYFLAHEEQRIIQEQEREANNSDISMSGK